MGDAYARVLDSDLDYGADLLFRWHGKPFTGVGYSTDPVRSELTYVDGLQTGPARDFHASGEVSAESSYFEGCLHGWSRAFAENGEVLSEELYEFGMLVSPVSGQAVSSTHQPLIDRYRAERQGWPAVR